LSAKLLPKGPLETAQELVYISFTIAQDAMKSNNFLKEEISIEINIIHLVAWYEMPSWKFYPIPER